MMLEGTPAEQSQEAFRSILAELQTLRDRLVKELSVAAETADYGAISEFTSRLKRADVLKIELERLEEEWWRIFNAGAVQPGLPEIVDDGKHPLVAVPDQYELCSPTMDALRTLGGAGRNLDIAETVIGQMHLPKEVTRQLHEGGPQTELDWQLGWARTILKTCGFVDNPQQGLWELTDCGTRHLWMAADEIRRLYRQRLDERRQRSSQ